VPRHRVPSVAGNQGYFTVHIDIIVDSLKKNCIIKMKLATEFPFYVKSEFSDNVYGLDQVKNNYKSVFTSNL